MIKLLLALILLVVLYVGGVLLYGTVNDFQPEEIIQIETSQKAKKIIISDTTLRLITWNLGYGGLGAEADFFFDSQGMLKSGGKMIRPTRDLVDKYIKGEVDFVKNTPADFYLFQEVDFNSKRSYYNNQFQAVANALPDYGAAYAVNYLSDWVPIPLLEPWHAYGRVNAGLATYSRCQPSTSTRYQLPGDYPWPTRIFQLDRCALVQKFPTSFGRDLVIINIHNSAYDKGGLLKAQQMVYLHDLFEREYAEGNYVIVGGDWNQCPPDFKFDALMPGKAGPYTQTNVSKDFMQDSGWQWVANTAVPTNRKVRSPYIPGKTFETVIDFFLVSPNVKFLGVRGIHQGFAFSDHQPVLMEVELVTGE